MLITARFVAYATFAYLGTMSTAVLAGDPPYTEGAVVNVTAIRTEYGKSDEYMKFLATTWKQEREAQKKAGIILSYNVYKVEPRRPDDADIYLVITYKNWASLDGLTERENATAKHVYGSVNNAKEGSVDRGKIRRVLGSMTLQEIVLN